MRGLAVIGGEGPLPCVLREIALGAGLLVAADSGLMACEEAGLKPDWICGDMDSLDDISRLAGYPREKVLRHPRDKDLTDTELALELLREQGCDEIWISGGGGGRLDHLFAIRALFERDDGPDRWFPGGIEADIRRIREGAILAADLPPGSIVSVFVLGMGPWEAGSSGLKWPLSGLNWKIGSYGISNVTLGASFEIHSKRGSFMAILPMVFGENQP